MGDRTHAVKASLEIVRKLGQGKLHNCMVSIKGKMITGYWFGLDIEQDEQEQYERHIVESNNLSNKCDCFSELWFYYIIVSVLS